MEDKPNVRIRSGWDREGRLGTLLAGPVRDLQGTDWMVVHWNGDADPDLHKAAGLEVAATTWKAVQP